MRALLVVGLIWVAAAPLAAAAACGSEDRCLDVVFVVRSDPVDVGGQFVGFYAIGGAPGLGAVVAKATEGASAPVRCVYDSSVCQTPRAPQVSVRRGECLDVVATLLLNPTIGVSVTRGEANNTEITVSVADTWTYCR